MDKRAKRTLILALLGGVLAVAIVIIVSYSSVGRNAIEQWNYYWDLNLPTNLKVVYNKSNSDMRLYSNASYYVLQCKGDEEFINSLSKNKDDKFEEDFLGLIEDPSLIHYVSINNDYFPNFDNCYSYLDKNNSDDYNAWGILMTYCPDNNLLYVMYIYPSGR